MVPSGSSNDDTKPLFLCEIHFLFLTRHSLNHQRKNRQHINLLYNDVRNQTYSFSCCCGPKVVSSNDDRKALFLCEIHILLIFTSRSLNNQRTNKQLITLLHNEKKRVSFSAAAMVSTLYFQRKNEKHYISEIITFHLFLQVDLQIISGHTSNQLTFSTCREELNFHFELLLWSEGCVF